MRPATVISYHTPWGLRDHRLALTARKKAQQENEVEFISSRQADKLLRNLHDLDNKLGSYAMKILIGEGNLRGRILGPIIWCRGQEYLARRLLERARKKPFATRSDG